MGKKWYWHAAEVMGLWWIISIPIVAFFMFLAWVIPHSYPRAEMVAANIAAVTLISDMYAAPAFGLLFGSLGGSDPPIKLKIFEKDSA